MDTAELFGSRLAAAWKLKNDLCVRKTGIDFAKPDGSAKLCRLMPLPTYAAA
jgi:hypothetical protein